MPYVTIDVPLEDRLRAIAEEAAIADRDLDAIEAKLAGWVEADPSRASALALTVGRSGRAESKPALQRCQQIFRASDRQERALFADTMTLAIDLLAPIPDRARIERADLGYRYQLGGGGELFVEDPLAAHWHARGVWGPPLRPDLEQRPEAAEGEGQVERLHSAALLGRRVRIHFERPRGLDRFEEEDRAPLFLTCAGFARDPGLVSLVRWSAVRSAGEMVGRGTPRVAIEHPGGMVTLPRAPSIPEPDLLALVTRLLKRARS